jgi:hypothetical protein
MKKMKNVKEEKEALKKYKESKMQGITVIKKGTNLGSQEFVNAIAKAKPDEYVTIDRCSNCKVDLILTIEKGLLVGDFLEGKLCPCCGCALSDFFSL